MMPLGAMLDRWLSSRPHWRQKAMESLEMCEAHAEESARYRGALRLLEGMRCEDEVARDVIKAVTNWALHDGAAPAMVEAAKMHARLVSRSAQAGVTEGRDALAARGAEGE